MRVFVAGAAILSSFCLPAAAQVGRVTEQPDTPTNPAATQNELSDDALIASTGAPAPAPVMLTGKPVVARITALRQRLENPSRRCGEECLSPVEAVTYAAYLAPRAALASDFRLEVKAVGTADRSWFLNSELDYRDRNCLTIRLSPGVAESIRQTYDNKPLEDILKGRTIQVKGIARRVRIDFIGDGQPTGKYYYQTHVNVDNVRQLGFLETPEK